MPLREEQVKGQTLRTPSPRPGSCRRVSPPVLGAKSTDHGSGACAAGGDAPPGATRWKGQRRRYATHRARLRRERLVSDVIGADRKAVPQAPAAAPLLSPLTSAHPVTAHDSNAVVRITQGDDVIVSPCRRTGFPRREPEPRAGLPGEDATDADGVGKREADLNVGLRQRSCVYSSVDLKRTSCPSA